MEQLFTFGFSGDDVDETEYVNGKEGEASVAEKSPVTTNVSSSALESPRSLGLGEMLSNLPSKISYSTLEIVSPHGKSIRIPRRELFDIRMQLMAEDDLQASELVGGLHEIDIKPNVYEGGLKTWECSVDLAKLLLDHGPRKHLDDLCRVDHVVELGCGTAIPSMVLFNHALNQSLPMYFTLTDYNSSVLRLATCPNLLLSWAKALPSPTSAPFDHENINPLHTASTGELEITPTLILSFLESLKSLSIHVTLISGSWTPPNPFLALIPSAPELNTFVLASETIYSPASITSFTETLVAILKTARIGKSVIAAKRMYFGVGGSVDSFKRIAASMGAIVSEMNQSVIKQGVSRALIEIQLM